MPKPGGSAACEWRRLGGGWVGSGRGGSHRFFLVFFWGEFFFFGGEGFQRICGGQGSGLIFIGFAQVRRELISGRGMSAGCPAASGEFVMLRAATSSDPLCRRYFGPHTRAKPKSAPTDTCWFFLALSPHCRVGFLSARTSVPA